MIAIQENDVLNRSNLVSMEPLRREPTLPLVREMVQEEIQRREWNLQLARLRKWWRNPEQLSDEAASAPTKTLLESAIRVGVQMQTRGLPPPKRVVPTDEGGIAFERWTEDITEVYEFLPDGSRDIRKFVAGSLVSRVKLNHATSGFVLAS